MTEDKQNTDVKQFLDRYRRTFARTLEILSAIPQDRWDWRPAETMRSFRDLVGQILSNELIMSRGILEGEWVVDPSLDFGSSDEAMGFFRRLHEDVVSGLAMMNNEAFHTKIDSPFEGTEDSSPERKMTRAQLAYRMLEQELHHRGSLYVYLRLVGVQIPGVPNGQ